MDFPGGLSGWSGFVQWIQWISHGFSLYILFSRTIRGHQDFFSPGQVAESARKAGPSDSFKWVLNGF